MPSAQIRDRIEQTLIPALGVARVTCGMLEIATPRDTLVELVRRLMTEFGFDLFLDVTAVDWPQRVPRFDVVYHFYSTTHHMRIRIRTQAPETEPVVDSLVPFYGAAGFMERECHDMYGIVFRGNADLRPILLYEGFTGHPLRKDYGKTQEQPLVPYRT